MNFVRKWSDYTIKGNTLIANEVNFTQYMNEKSPLSKA